MWVETIPSPWRTTQNGDLPKSTNSPFAPQKEFHRLPSTIIHGLGYVFKACINSHHPQISHSNQVDSATRAALAASLQVTADQLSVRLRYQGDQG